MPLMVTWLLPSFTVASRLRKVSVVMIAFAAPSVVRRG